jgi:hypothetical protein
MTRVRPAHVLLKWQLPYLKVSDSRLIGPISASIAALVPWCQVLHCDIPLSVMLPPQNLRSIALKSSFTFFQFMPAATVAAQRGPD